MGVRKMKVEGLLVGEGRRGIVVERGWHKGLINL